MAKQKIKNKNFLLIASLLIILSLQIVSSIGITPGRTTLNFEPGLHKEVSFSIINSEHKEFSVTFAVKGNLSEYITLSQDYAEFSSSEKSKSFSYTIDLPHQINKPGKYEIEIIAFEKTKDRQDQGTSIGAVLAVVTQLHIHVPYPDKYVEAEINVIESGDEAIFSIPVINRGKLDIKNIQAVVDIYFDDKKIATVKSNTDSLPSLKRKELVARWDADVNSGKYKAIVTIKYDGQETILSKEFDLGKMFLDIYKIVISDFKLGEIAKFDVFVENKWSGNLKDVYLDVIVYDDKGNVIADFISQNYDIDALSKSEMACYWDTVELDKGTYDGKLLLRYNNYSTKKDVQIEITDNNIKIPGLTKPSMFGFGYILAFVSFLIIAGILVWFFIKRKK